MGGTDLFFVTEDNLARKTVEKMLTRYDVTRQWRYINVYVNKNWLKFLFSVKVAALKQQISKFYPQIQEASHHTYFSQRPVIKCKRQLMCLEFADKILIVAVLKQRLLHRRETEEKLKPVFVLIIIAVLLHKTA